MSKLAPDITRLEVKPGLHMGFTFTIELLCKVQAKSRYGNDVKPGLHVFASWASHVM